jgi:hypothetical protein
MAKTARRILAVDEGARADHALVPAAPSMALLAGLQKKGFSQRWIAKALGYKHFATQFVHESEQITAANERAIALLAKKIEAEKIEAPPFKGWVPAGPTRALLRWMLDEGFTMVALTERLGVTVHSQSFERRFVRVSTADAVARLHRELNAEGDALPTDGVEHERIDMVAAVRVGERTAAEIASDFCVSTRTVLRTRYAARAS